MHGGPSTARRISWASNPTESSPVGRGRGDCRWSRRAKTLRARSLGRRRTWHLGIFVRMAEKRGSSRARISIVPNLFTWHRRRGLYQEVAK